MPVLLFGIDRLKCVFKATQESVPCALNNIRKSAQVVLLGAEKHSGKYSL